MDTLLARLLLVDPDRAEARAAGLSEAAGARPNRWQLTLGGLRMLHRVVFRSETIGTSRAPVRPTLRARAFARRPLRAPALLATRAIAPLDLLGLGLSDDRLRRHLIGAHHDGRQAAYDLELLLASPGALRALRAEVAAIVDGTHPRAAWWQDLCVHEGYHARLLGLIDEALAGAPLLTGPAADDPDLSLLALLRWCARQPASLAATRAAWAAGWRITAP